MGLIRRVFLISTAVAVTSYGWMYWDNNKSESPPQQQAVLNSLERGVLWLERNRDRILDHDNPALWRMIGESAVLSKDPRLHQLYAEFCTRYETDHPQSVWEAFLAPERYREADIPPQIYKQLADYQQYFLYAATCSREMAADPAINSQHDPGFCGFGTGLVRPTCATHQLLGYQLAQRNGCPVPELDSSISRLQRVIRMQLELDPRLVDFYVQRVLMLAASGAAHDIRPRWLRRVLEAQLPDGGWNNMQALITLPGGIAFGFSSSGLGWHQQEGAFHTTAQGVWLMALMQNQELQGQRHPPRAAGR